MKTSTKSKSDLYETEKLTFAAYIVASGKARFISTSPVPGSKIVSFILSNPPADGDVDNFFSGKAMVSAIKFAAALNTLKSAAFEAKRNL
jgi:hypothetical protein